MDGYLKLSEQSEKLARAYAGNCDYGKAFAHLLVYLSVRTCEKPRIEEYFVKITTSLANELHKENRNEDLVTTFESAIEEYPNNLTLLNSFGCFLVRLGKIEHAYKIIDQAILADPCSLISHRNMHQIKDMLVPRWHFRMLNDSNRNMAYRNAILKQISMGYDNVLDIGTGTGLLSLFALEGKPKSVQACDYSDTMIDIAKKVFQSNKSANVNLLNISSLDIDPNNFSKASLIVTEILDSGIFGENIINSVLHASEHLTSSHWNIVPCAITVHIAAIQSETIFHKSRLKKTKLLSLSDNRIYAHSDDDQPYDTENLRHIKDVKFMSQTEVLYQLDLRSKNLKSILDAKKYTTMKCIETGYIDAFVVWMTLKLDEDNIISSSPQSAQNSFCCWDQAIFAVKKQFYVNKDDKFFISSYCSDGVILKIENDYLKINKNSFPLPGTILEFLNDNLYLQKLNELLQYIKKNAIPSTIILDLSPVPILGLLLLKEKSLNRLVCKKTSDDNVERFIELIAQINNIDMSNISFCSFEEMQNNIEYNIIIFNWIQETGELSEEFLSQTDLIRFLAEDGLMIPSRINIKGLIVQSEWLDFISRVSDVNVNNYKIAEHINQYRIKKHIDFKIQSLDYIPCSQVIDFGCVSLDIKRKMDIIQTPMDCKCSINGILYWYDIILQDSGISYCTNNQHGFIKNAAFLFDKKDCYISDTISIQIIQQDGLLKMDVSN